MTIQVGDKLAQKDYPTYRIYTVTKILPSGRIKVQWDDPPRCCEYTINPNLSVRGERGERLQIITPEIENEIERRRLLTRIEIGFLRRNKVTLVQAQSLHQWMIDAGLLTD